MELSSLQFYFFYELVQWRFEQNWFRYHVNKPVEALLTSQRTHDQQKGKSAEYEDRCQKVHQTLVEKCPAKMGNPSPNANDYHEHTQLGVTVRSTNIPQELHAAWNMLQRLSGTTATFACNKESLAPIADAETAFIFVCATQREITTPEVDYLTDETSQQYLARIQNIKNFLPPGDAGWNQQLPIQKSHNVLFMPDWA